MRQNRLVLPLLVVGLLSPARAASGQSDNVFDGVHPHLADAAYLGLMITLDVGLGSVSTPRNPNQEPPDIDLDVRDALVWQNTSAARTLSDVAVYTELAVGVLGPILFEWSLDEREISATMVGMEAIATTRFLTTLFKHLTGRERPGAGTSTHISGNRSFFSGHVATAFASATLLTAFAYEYDWLSDRTRWIIPVSAFLLAGFTAYLRMAGDAHWFTDVVTGAAAGTATAYLVFSIRTGG